uniref:Nuclear transport factor 2 domain-containing protein n=2 Tax=Timema TaxID=61471 RepID=A0A7R9D108_TIMPO|nr:unnamed protein product [Timema douglasi]CAD7405696.1 unnamed protein product [Timema poppensis]
MGVSDRAVATVASALLEDLGVRKHDDMSNADDDPPHAYSQVFVLKPLGSSFYCQHDIFRLGIHDTA